MHPIMNESPGTHISCEYKPSLCSGGLFHSGTEGLRSEPNVNTANAPSECLQHISNIHNILNSSGRVLPGHPVPVRVQHPLPPPVHFIAGIWRVPDVLHLPVHLPLLRPDHQCCGGSKVIFTNSHRILYIWWCALSSPQCCRCLYNISITVWRDFNTQD